MPKKQTIYRALSQPHNNVFMIDRWSSSCTKPDNHTFFSTFDQARQNLINDIDKEIARLQHFRNTLLNANEDQYFQN